MRSKREERIVKSRVLFLFSTEAFFFLVDLQIKIRADIFQIVEIYFNYRGRKHTMVTMVTLFAHV